MQDENGASVPQTIIWGLYVVVILAVFFFFLIFLVPLPTYRLVGHCFEVCVSLICVASSVYAYTKLSRRAIFLLAAFAFGGYALATTFWYLFSIAVGRSFVYISIAELGFLGFLLIFIAAITVEFPLENTGVWWTISCIVISLAIPLLVFWDTGTSQPVHDIILAVRFLLAGLLIAVSISHGVYKYSLLWTGICLRCIAGMLYGIRETIFTTYSIPLFSSTPASQALSAYDFLSVIGPLVILSFALIQLGLFQYILLSKSPPVAA